METIYNDFFTVLETASSELLSSGSKVDTSSWQGQKDPRFNTLELLNFSFGCPVPRDLDILRKQVLPNLPWADEHFEERVSGIPYNPPPSHIRWPFWKASSEATKEVEGEKFSHTYPERFWPKKANIESVPRYLRDMDRRGIRYAYGDLNDVVHLLHRDPLTRQAYLPIFFPEDTGATYGGRVPCTLGYYFINRSGYLHMVYSIRSCDLLRHFQDDIYLACRLLLWVHGRLMELDPSNWTNVPPGNLTMHIYSLHIFEEDTPAVIYRSNLRRRDARTKS